MKHFSLMGWGWRSVVGLSIATMVLPLAKAGPEALHHIRTYERYIAVDGACAWPNLVALPNGELAAMIWPHSSHGYTEGSAECWISANHGVTWKKACVPVPFQPGTNRMNLAAGLTGDGVLVVAVSGWDKRPPFSEEARLGLPNFTGASTLTPILAFSRDFGRTWTGQREVTLPGRTSKRATIPFGRIAALPRGELGMMVYSDEVDFITSADGGKTWAIKGRVSTRSAHNETTWIRLDNGDLYAAARKRQTGLEGFRSTDGGVTWKSEGPITMPLQQPADLRRLPDGRVLLSFGVRNSGFYGVAVRIGDAKAREWGAPIFLVDLDGATDSPAAREGKNELKLRDGGYPSSIVLSDGMIVTAYYSRGVPMHQRYHMGVVRWTLPEVPAK